MNIKSFFKIFFKILLSLGILYVSYIAFLFIALLGSLKYSFNPIIILLCSGIIPFTLLFVWNKVNRKKLLIIWLIYIMVSGIVVGINYGVIKHKESLVIKTDINIDINQYMPFDNNSKIVKLDKEASLKLEDNLPKLDGAAAVFPVYSAFINAVYPDTVKIDDECFRYNNTVKGYDLLARKEIDIFFGAYPSKEQLAYAKENDTEFEFIEIGKEGFVFFVNKNNLIDSLTSQQIKDIYSGKITNWKEVGGENKKILPFQRNEGSGSQSMLKRFMDGTPIIKPETKEVNEFMGGIIEEVADYRNHDNSIGFSFRYYLESIIANPNVKMLSIDGIEPTKENITNGSYPITTSLYAVTYKGNDNENVQKLIDWILSEEGQTIIEKTGYARVK